MSPPLRNPVGAVAGPRPGAAISLQHSGLLRQGAERIYLRLFNGMGKAEYHSLGLHRASLTWSEKKEFVGKRWYHTMIERVNPREYRIAAWNKVLAYGALQSFSIPTPRLYGTASPANGTTCDGLPLRSADDLGALIDRYRLERLCFKLVGGWSGAGFLLVSFARGGDGAMVVRVAGTERSYTLDQFWDACIAAPDAGGGTERQRAFGYLCQEAVDQHPDIAAMHQLSLNTVRVWMAQREPGAWDMFGAVLRMGTGAVVVDNGAAGGIGAPVDLKTGRLGRAIRRGRAGIEFAEYRYHPTTGALVEGTFLPMWTDVVELCQRACPVFPFLRFMGLDIAITADGATVIEIEADPHQSHQAHLGYGMRSLMVELARSRPRMLR